MSKLLFSAPTYWSELFEVPSDKTAWSAIASGLDPYRKVNAGHTPNREQASYGRLTAALEPRGPEAESLVQTYGVYLLAFGSDDQNQLHKAFYVGVAGNTGRHPEGVLVRVRKHRVKVTGSHVGNRPDSVGGVNHTQGWRRYAQDRYRYHVDHGLEDTCQDARVVVGKLSLDQAPTKVLEFFEHAIFNNHAGVRNAIYRLLWPGLSEDPWMLTTSSNKGEKPSCPVIELWDGSLFNIESGR